MTDLATQRRRHIADILRAHQSGHLDLVSAVDAIELDVFGQPAGQPEPPSPAAALVTVVTAMCLTRHSGTVTWAVDMGQMLADELKRRGILAALEG